MLPLGIIILKGGGQARAEDGRGFIDSQVDILVLHTAPQMLDKDIVDPPPFSVHADVDFMRA